MSTSQNVERRIKQNAIIKGLLLGVIITALSIFSFYFITRLTREPFLILLVMYMCSPVLPALVSIFFCMDMRKRIGGYWGLRQAVTGIFFMFLIAYAILSIGRDLVFAKFIAPDMVAKVENVMIGVKESRLRAQGAPPDVIVSQISELKKELTVPAHVRMIDVLNDYLKTIILLFAIAVIFAAIFKKENLLLINGAIIKE